MMTSQQPSSTALPAKQRPDAMPTSGTSPARRGEAIEACVEPLTRVSVSPAAPAAALGEEHDRQPPALRQLEHAVLLVVTHVALGAGHHRVVVGDDDARGPVSPKCSPLICAEPDDQAVGRRFARSAARSAPCAAAPQAPARRIRRSCRDRRGRRCSRARCAGRSCAGAATASGRAASSVRALAIQHLREVGADRDRGRLPSCARTARRARLAPR